MDPLSLFVCRWARRLPVSALIPAAFFMLCSGVLPGDTCASSTRLLQGGPPVNKTSFLSAYSSIIGSTAVIEAQAGTFRESLVVANGADITLAGGHDAVFTNVVGKSYIEGSLEIQSGSVIADSIALTSPRPGPVRIIYLHHSTGSNIWEGGVPEFIAAYNTGHGVNYEITERAYPDWPYPWENYPYDYWNLWVNASGSVTDPGIASLDVLASEYDVIMFKHCFPVSGIEADTDTADISSPTKSIENYTLQYEALKAKMHQFPDNKFIVWTGAALVQNATDPGQAGRADAFFEWVRTTWDEKGDNIFVWDFWTLETGGGIYMLDAHTASSGDSHPNATFSGNVAPYIGQRIVDVIEEAGDSTNITGQ
ncbi:MAG: hypothetical protein C0402_15580 [Thermodesulfovibrio sp.]|nr:hypothetical protein [Thermodesulfovibrio sp.]